MSDSKPPRDNSGDFDDPAELARWHEEQADFAWARMGGCDRSMRKNLQNQFAHHCDEATRLRALAARGEKVPRF